MLKSFFSLIFFCTLFVIGEQPVSSLTVIENKAILPILTPSLAERQVLKLRLDNGLEAYLISDPHVDQSSAALTVQTGSWQDPTEYPGTAHFLEHMLFLGTKKYPNESEYHRFMSEHGGLTNAFTASDITGYVFTINHDAFPEGLDRFANFFIEPLFNPSGVSRELNAINQEYGKNIEDDDIREYYVLKELANPTHPHYAFGMGNSASLQKVSQETLKKWYREHYSANLMHLEVISNLPLDKLQELVINDFKDIRNTNLPLARQETPIFPDSLKGHMVYIEPVKSLHQLSLIWELPNKFENMQETKPDRIIGYVLGHEGKNSLLDDLKKNKLAEGIACGGVKIGRGSFAFYLQIDLTDLGAKNSDQVITKTFAAINNFKKVGIPNYLFDELHNTEVVDYQYQTREDAFETIFKEAMQLPQENLATYPECTKITQKFDPQASKELLDFLTPQNAIFSFMASSNLTGVSPEHTEQWLGANYAIKAIPTDTLKQWSQTPTQPNIALPEPNPFILEQHKLMHKVVANSDSTVTSPSWLPRPALIHDNNLAKIFFAADTLYNLPKVSWIFEIKTPNIKTSSPESVVLAELFVKMVSEALSSYTYPASLAGLDFDLKRSDNGLALGLEGYSGKADLLFFDLLKTMKDFKPNEGQFKVTKANLQRQYNNSAIDKPMAQASEILKTSLYKHFVTNKQKAQLIKKIQFDQFEEFTKTLFQKSYVEGTLYGNMSEESAKHLTDELLAILGSQPYPVEEQEKKAVVVLPEEQGPFFIDAKTKAQGNAAFLCIQSEPFSFSARAAQQVLMQAMKEPFFSTLRTKQQTGYIVVSEAEEIEKHLFHKFAVQSNTHDARDLLARFELFIEEFLREIESQEITPERFNNIKQAQLTTLSQAPKNIDQMCQLLHRLAFTYDGDFDWMSKRIHGFKELTYEEFLKFAQETLGKENKRRVAVLLSGAPSDISTLQYKRLNNVSQLRQLSAYISPTRDNH